jgi:hypothetical protein
VAYVLGWKMNRRNVLIAWAGLIATAFVGGCGCRLSEGEEARGELIGVWATKGSSFNDGVLVSGEAIYIADGGDGVWIGAQPPIAFRMRVERGSTEGALRVRGRSGDIEVDAVLGVEGNGQTLVVKASGQLGRREFCKSGDQISVRAQTLFGLGAGRRNE